jgi:ketosteroid isomerase-like protein
MCDHPNLDLMRRGYGAYTSGDMNTINQLLADDVVWHIAGRSPISGDYRGKDEGFGYFGTLQEMSNGTSTVEVHDLLANDDHGVAIVTEYATRHGQTHEARSMHRPRERATRALGCVGLVQSQLRERPLA